MKREWNERDRQYNGSLRDYAFGTEIPNKVACYVRNTDPTKNATLSASVQAGIIQTQYPGATFVASYFDTDFGNPEAMKSVGLVKLLEECTKGGIDTIYCDSIMTFSETMTGTLEILKILLDHGVAVYFQHEDLLSSEMVFNVFDMVYKQVEHERENGLDTPDSNAAWASLQTDGIEMQ